MKEIANGTFRVFLVSDTYEYKEADVAVRLIDSEGNIKWFWRFNGTLEPASSRPDELEKLYNKAVKNEYNHR